MCVTWCGDVIMALATVLPYTEVDIELCYRVQKENLEKYEAAWKNLKEVDGKLEARPMHARIWLVAVFQIISEPGLP